MAPLVNGSFHAIWRFSNNMANKHSDDTCQNCKQALHTGDLVKMDWAGHPTEHINCPEPIEALAQAA